jgi:DNA-binding FadR family transcriptional regulator
MDGAVLGMATRSPRTRSYRAPKVAELIAQDLRSQIIRRELEEGAALPPESELMEQFGVSRPTLREALRVLEAESLISMHRGAHGGARVRAPNPQVAAQYAALLLQIRGTALEDVYRARSLVEPPAARRVTELRNPDSIGRLREALEDELRMAHAPAAGAVLGALFHLRLMEAADNSTMRMIAEMLIAITDRRVSDLFNESEFPNAAEAQTRCQAAHRKLVNLIESGDADAAELHWRGHLESVMKGVLAVTGADATLDLPD